MADNIAISVKHVAKSFLLPHEKQSSIKSSVVSIFKKKDKTVEVQHALREISFDVKKGDFFGIVGRNGSGKSTLLKILAGIYQPTHGTVEVDGKLVSFIELGVGFNSELTGRENVYLNGALLGFTRKQIDDMYDDIVGFAELEDFMDQKLKNYSSGMQVRLAFSVAIKAKGDILILDEVLAVGDEAFQRKCHEYFKSLQNSDTTVVLVTHSMTAVREYCNKALLINDSRIIAYDDNVDRVADEYSKLFLPKQGESKDGMQKGGDRFGTGDVEFSNIKHSYTKEKLSIEFDITNTTNGAIDGVELGFNFFSGGQVVTGNGTRYTDGYKEGFHLNSKEKKHFEVEFPNRFGNFGFDVHMNVRGEGGHIVYDEIKPAFKFDSNNTHMSRFLKVTLPLTIHEG